MQIEKMFSFQYKKMGLLDWRKEASKYVAGQEWSSYLEKY